MSAVRSARKSGDASASTRRAGGPTPEERAALADQAIRGQGGKSGLTKGSSKKAPPTAEQKAALLAAAQG